MWGAAETWLNLVQITLDPEGCQVRHFTCWYVIKLYVLQELGQVSTGGPRSRWCSGRRQLAIAILFKALCLVPRICCHDLCCRYVLLLFLLNCIRSLPTYSVILRKQTLNVQRFASGDFSFAGSMTDFFQVSGNQLWHRYLCLIVFRNIHV